MNAQAAALVLVRRAATSGAVVELPPKPKGFPCVNAQVDKSRFPGGCFDVDAPLLEGQLEETDSVVVSATKPYAKVLESVRKVIQFEQSLLSMRRMDANLRKASALRDMFSKSLASLRQRPSHAKVLSTTQRLGKTSKPLAVSETERPVIFLGLGGVQ